MSRKRNRNIRHEFKRNDLQAGLNIPHFGEYIVSPEIKEINNSLYQDFDNLSISKSSSSSLSWGEDCEVEATQKVKCEYERMNNVLRGLEPIPPNYDEDEYKLWIRTFPHLRIRDLTPKNISGEGEKCDNLSKNILKTTVIDDLLNMPNKLTNSSGSSQYKIFNKRRNNKEENVQTPVENNLESDFQTFLRISPAPSCDKPNNLENRRRSTNYINKTTNFLNVNSDYASLPHLPQQTNEIFLNAKVRNREIARRKPKTRKVNRLVLPPIDTALNQFRSISAIPLQQQNKCSSALSTKTNLNFVFDFDSEKPVVGDAKHSNVVSGKKRLKGYF